MSAQTRNRARLQAWKETVRAAAIAAVPAGAAPADGPFVIVITYYYEGETPDVDNIIKPIQDAMIGVVFVDDRQAIETRCRKRSLDGTFKIKGASAVLLNAFADGESFLHIRVSEPADGGDLTQ